MTEPATGTVSRAMRPGSEQRSATGRARPTLPSRSSPATAGALIARGDEISTEQRVPGQATVPKWKTFLSSWVLVYPLPRVTRALRAWLVGAGWPRRRCTIPSPNHSVT